MDVNENILLVVIGFADPFTKKTFAKLSTPNAEEQLEVEQLVLLWKKYGYSILYLEEEGIAKNEFGTHHLINKVQQLEEYEMSFSSALRTKPFFSIALLGVADKSILDFTTQFAQMNNLKLYQVSDAIYNLQPQTQSIYWFKKITSHQIFTLFKSIKDS